MPEYFDISLIIGKSELQKQQLQDFLLHTFNLHEEENDSLRNEISAFKNVILTIYESEEINFIEFGISIPKCVFHKKSFDREFNPIDLFITRCLKECKFIRFALCSYEMNAYYIGKLQRIEDFTPLFLAHFPITYSKDLHNESFSKIINTTAQDIFV